MNSGPFLPAGGIAAGVKTRFDDKKQRVGKAAQEGAADILEHCGKLPGIITHPFDHGVNRLAKTSGRQPNTLRATLFKVGF